MPRVAVENSLGSVKEYLQNKGVEVISLEAGQKANYDCCVISGQDKDVMGIADVTTKAPVVNAEGMTEEEVYQAVNQRLMH